jgi:hypothetical protein
MPFLDAIKVIAKLSVISLFAAQVSAQLKWSRCFISILHVYWQPLPDVPMV